MGRFAPGNLDLDGKVILITGGTGSFGRRFIETVLTRYALRKVIVYSRDELKQSEMQQELREQFDAEQMSRMRFFLGDVRDRARLTLALRGVDIVIHAAALKQVPAAEYNPSECIQTNIIGAENVVWASLTNRVQQVVALSTDKACNPVNLYGATKLASDKTFVAANNLSGDIGTKFSVVRYGNVVGSRGSVVPLFRRLLAQGATELPITDARMTRFWITLNEGVEFVLSSLEIMRGGEIFVPKIPSYRITDVATAIGPECRQEIVGVRPGEKIHEEMITASDSFNTVDLGRYFAILPSAGEHSVSSYCSERKAKPVPPGFAYNSGANPDFLSVDRLRELIAQHAGALR
jgi:UDP-N-acetylglucosamine 4,6-dehydratase